MSVSGTRDCGQLGEIQSSSSPENSLSRCDYRLHSFQGFSFPSESREAVLNHRRISVLRRSASLFLARAPRSTVVFDSACSGGEVTDAISTASASPSLGSQGRFPVNSLGLGLPSRSGMVVGSGSSPTGHVSDSSQPTPLLLVRRFGLGSSPSGQHRFRPVVFGGSHSVYERKGASCGGKRLLQFEHLLSNSTVAIFSDNSTALAYLRKQVGTRSTILNAISQRILRWAETIYLVLASQFIQGKHNVLADSLSRPNQIQGSEWTEVGGVPPVVQEGTLFTLFFALPRSLSDRYGCASSELGRVSGVCLSTVVNDTAGSEEAPLIFWGPHDSSCSILAPEAVVPGPSRPRSGRSDLSSGVLRSPETTTFSLPSSRDPQAVPSCLETIQLFTKAKGFSTSVAKQLGFARRLSSRAVCQAKWLVYHSWCRNESHSISRPTLPKIAAFILWLRRVRKLSVSAVMGYRSMLSSVFRFKLSEISSSPVLQDLLRSFKVETPFRVVQPPSWDLNKVLNHLRSSTYEPLANFA